MVLHEPVSYTHLDGYKRQVDAFDISAGFKKILRFLAPYLAFGVFLLVNAIAKHDLSHFYIYGLVILVMIACDIASKGNPARMLLIFSCMGILSLAIGMMSSGMTSVYACLLYTSRCV